MGFKGVKIIKACFRNVSTLKAHRYVGMYRYVSGSTESSALESVKLFTTNAQKISTDVSVQFK